MIGFCVDSNAQLPDELRDRYKVEVVPLTVSIDGRDYLENVDLDADTFYSLLGSARTPVTTAAPSPGRFGIAYARLAKRGATEILSVHLGSALSATVSAAHLAARDAPVPVRVVDTQTASFEVSCCLWEAAEAIAAGATVEQGAAAAEATGARCANVFVVAALDLLRVGGRLAPGTRGDADGVDVLSLIDGQVRTVGTASGWAQAIDVMADTILGSGLPIRAGVGIADASAAPLWHGLEARLLHAPGVRDVVRYRVGPSVGAHTGPGTAGACWYPLT